jgi:hypothetical protein
MKRIGLVLILAAVFAGMTFAQEDSGKKNPFIPDFHLSAGLIGDLGLHFGATPYTSEMKDMLGSSYDEFDESNVWWGAGVAAFFDATYARAALGFGFGGTIMSGGSPIDYPSFFTMELLGKYPFELSPKFTIYPLIGIQYQLWTQLTEKQKDYDGNGNDRDVTYTRSEYEDSVKKAKDAGVDLPGAENYDRFWIKFGFDFDIGKPGGFYLPMEILYGIKFNSKSEQDAIDDGMFESVSFGGPTFKIGVGYRIK